MAGWCNLTANCTYSIAADIIKPQHLRSYGAEINMSNMTNPSCGLPFCVEVLSYTIKHSRLVKQTHIIDNVKVDCSPAIIKFESKIDW